MLPLVALGPRRHVNLQGQRIPLEYDFRRWMWRNERCLELALGRLALAVHTPHTVLEIGNVMPLAGAHGHTVVDKYETGAGIINEDVLTFASGRRYGLVLSISTFEHVGWDEEPRDPDKASAALSRLSGLVEEDGALLVTIPVGDHRRLERSFVADDGPFDAVSLFVKASRLARWEPRPPAERGNVRYGSPYANGNAVLVGTRGTPFRPR